MGISASVARKLFIEIPTVGKSGEFDLKYPNCNSVTIGECNQNSSGWTNCDQSPYVYSAVQILKFQIYHTKLQMLEQIFTESLDPYLIHKSCNSV